MRYLPVLIGLFLGVVSVVMGQVSRGVAQFSGMTIIGNEVGYLWAALILAWVNWKSWRKGFFAGFISLSIASGTYYGILLFQDFFTSKPSTEPWHSQLIGFVFWVIIGGAVCVLAATAVWMARCAKQKWLNIGIFVLSYIGLIGASIYYNRMFVVRFFGISLFPHNYADTYRVIGYFFEAGFAFAITTVLFVIAISSLKKHNATKFE